MASTADGGGDAAATARRVPRRHRSRRRSRWWDRHWPGGGRGPHGHRRRAIRRRHPRPRRHGLASWCSTVEQAEQVRRLPGARGASLLSGLALFPRDAGFLNIVASVDGHWGVDHDRARIDRGRDPDPGSPDEIVLGESVADHLGVDVGDVLTFDSWSPEQVAAMLADEVAEEAEPTFLGAHARAPGRRHRPPPDRPREQRPAGLLHRPPTRRVAAPRGWRSGSSTSVSSPSISV